MMARVAPPKRTARSRACRRRPASFRNDLNHDLVLTNTERWVLREMLSLTPDRVDYFLHKCGKNGMTKRAAMALAEVFDIDVPEERWATYARAR